MSKEEAASIMTYCKEKAISYKIRLKELGLPPQRFYDARRHNGGDESTSGKGEFLQLQSEGAISQKIPA